MFSDIEGTQEERRAFNAFIKLTRAAESIGACVHRQLAEKGITTSQIGVLEMLLHFGPLSQGKIGRLLLRSGGNMTLVIDNLEKRGLVKRTRDQVDRRFYIIDLTTEGKRLAAEIFPEHLSAIFEQMKVLTREEQEELGRLCAKLETKTTLNCNFVEERAS
ncbi:MAG: MarR family transcriptional regulator [Syntrophobacteraceae bacterium]